MLHYHVLYIEVLCYMITCNAVEAQSCVDTASEMTLDKQYTTVDIIQWQDVSTRRSLSTAYKDLWVEMSCH